MDIKEMDAFVSALDLIFPIDDPDRHYQIDLPDHNPDLIDSVGQIQESPDDSDYNGPDNR